MPFFIGSQRQFGMILTKYFNVRLYGMFPCNFLFFMMQQDYDSNSSTSVFNGKK